MDLLLDNLKRIIVKKGNFVLRSGKTSSYYLDMREAYADPNMINALADALWNSTSKKATCVAGYGMGGIPLATVIASRNNLKLCILREKPKTYGTAKHIDGYLPSSEDNLLLIDDVYSTGSTFRDATEILNKSGIKINECAVIVLRTSAPTHPVTYVYNNKDLEIEEI